MAQKSISDEELQLKKRARRRLVGAIALVIAAVIFLPMVLDKQPKPVGQDIAIRIPSQEKSPFQAPSVTAPASQIADVAAAPPAKVAEAKPNETKPVDSEAPKSTSSTPAASDVPGGKTESQPIAAKPVVAKAESEAKPAAPKSAEKTAEKAGEKSAKPETAEKPAKPATVKQPPAKHEPSAKSEKSAKSQGYVILLGAFANLDNAKQRQAKLTALGVRFYAEKVKAPSGEKLRVRAGPYATRAEAEKVLGRLKAQGIKDGIVAEKDS